MTVTLDTAAGGQAAFDWTDPIAVRALELSTRELTGAIILKTRAAATHDDTAAAHAAAGRDDKAAWQTRMAAQTRRTVATYQRVLDAKQAGLLPAACAAPHDLDGWAAA